MSWEDGNASEKRSIFKAVKRSQATSTQKQKEQNGNRNNNNNDDDCNTTDSFDLQDVCSKQVRQF